MKQSRIAQIGVPAAIIGIIMMMVVPLPTLLLDMLLAFNIAFSVLIMLVSLRVTKPLDFSIFPALLLLATLFRLSLNIATTRLVLLNGDAGKVIEAFGHFVVGGSIVVGLVIFIILMIIQFVVITNGAGRVADAFLETRLASGWRSTYGMLDSRFDSAYIVDLLYPPAR